MKQKTIRRCEFREMNGKFVGCALVQNLSGSYATFHYDRDEGSEELNDHWWSYFQDDWEGALNEYTAIRGRLIEALDMAADVLGHDGTTHKEAL